MSKEPPADITFKPLTPRRWPDLEELFGPERGANSGCWCMWPRLARAEYKTMSKADRKTSLRRIVEDGPPPGLIAYQDGKAVGWCAVGPRAGLERFNSAKATRPVDGDGADAMHLYAMTCFFVRNTHRKLGLMRRLALAAIDFARAKGADAIEVCPIDADRPLIWGDGFVGISSVFESLGFEEVARRSPRRPLMRLRLSAKS
ncbi:Acetyltransferase (GNAT) family protein [Rhizobiales bacterium GAS191]|jgi:GNAT superfamily N-acetyltransferase|nr:Acetyltransferase (GNAT) family protein [Rhizobiales bacterium GAS113]SEC44617.1 Acetyltransferase (GNAT) family protein [Rhizobiales bacterium GAS191]